MRLASAWLRRWLRSRGLEPVLVDATVDRLDEETALRRAVAISRDDDLMPTLEG